MRLLHALVPSLLVIAAVASACSQPEREFGTGGSAGSGGSEAEQSSSPSSSHSASSSSASGSGGSGGGGTFCMPDATRSCYTGPASTEGIGACKSGAETCAHDGSAWGACTGDIDPQATDDCAAQVDTTCDGMLACACTPGTTQPCYDGPASTQGVGTCVGGTLTCKPDGSGYGACAGEVTPKGVDTCNDGLDDNCDGTIDDLCVCAPNTVASCYSGPAGTQGVGSCKAGSKTCNATGTAYGACSGEVDPGVEICSQHGDEDCDGISCSETVWSFLSGDAVDQHVTSVGADGSGNVYIAGYFAGQMGLVDKVANKTITLTSAGSNDYFLAKLTPAGDVIWAKRFGSAADNGTEIALGVDSSGNVAIGGDFQDQVDFGGGALVTPSYGAFVARFDGAGNHLWSEAFNASSSAVGRAVALTSTGDIVFGGYFSATMTMGTINLSVAGGLEVFVSKIRASDGKVLWAQTVSDTGCPSTAGVGYLDSIAVDANDNVFISGQHDYYIGFGGGFCLKSSQGQYDTDAFVAKLDALGVISWGHFFGTQGQTVNDHADRVAVAPNGDVLVLGVTNGATDFGGGTVNNGPVNFVVRYANGGSFLALKEFIPQVVGGKANVAYLPGLAVLPSGDVVLAGGVYTSPIDFGGGAITSVGGYDAVVVRLTPAFGHVWSKSYGDASNQFMTAMRYDDVTKSLVIGSEIKGSIDFGNGLLLGANTSNTDVGVAKIQP